MVDVEVLEKYVDTEAVLERLKGQNFKTQLDSLLQLAELMKNFDETAALTYAQKANLTAKGVGQKVSEAISIYYLTLLRERQQIFGEGLEEAIVDAKMCRRSFQKENRMDWLININNLIGIIYYRQSENDSALVYFHHTLQLLDKSKLPINEILNLRGDVYLDIANLYSTIDTAKANFYYDQSYLLYDSIKNQLALNRLKENMGSYYLYDIGSYEKAEKMFQQSLDYAQASNNTDLLRDSYLGLAYLNTELFMQTNDTQHFKKALNYLGEQLNHQQENLYFTFELIGNLYQDKLNISFRKTKAKVNINERYNDLDSAIINYKKSIFYAQEEGVINGMNKAGKNLFSLCNWRKEVLKVGCDSLLEASSLEFLDINYGGIVTTIENNLKLANEKIRKYEKNEQEAIHKQRISRNWIITGIGLISSAFIFLLLLQRLQQKRLVAKMEALRAQINPHFIANSLNAIESLVNLNKRKEASKYLVHFSRLSRRILNGSREAFISLAEELETLEHFLALEQLRFRDKLDYRIELSEQVNTKLIEVPAMIMQPYVENAIWHGIKPKTDTGFLKISIEKNIKHLICVIEDNGIGRAKSKALKENSVLKHKSQGMRISEERLEALGKMKGAKIKIIDLTDNKGMAIGTKVILRFPLKYKTNNI